VGRHSVQILLRIYSKCIDGHVEAARRRIDAALGLAAEDEDNLAPPGADAENQWDGTAGRRHRLARRGGSASVRTAAACVTSGPAPEATRENLPSSFSPDAPVARPA
jgi:hypothetical protein